MTVALSSAATCPPTSIASAGLKPARLKVRVKVMAPLAALSGSAQIHEEAGPLANQPILPGPPVNQSTLPGAVVKAIGACLKLSALVTVQLASARPPDVWMFP